MEEFITVYVICLIGYLFLMYDSIKTMLNKKKNKPIELTKIDIGNEGELTVAVKLENELTDEFHILNSIDGKMIYIKSYQIDHLVFHNQLKTIYVIETKNWGGYVTGTFKDLKWKCTYGNGAEYWHESPIKQNEKHCKVVKEKYPDYDIVNVVVFANNTTSWQCRSKNVMRYDKLVDFIYQDAFKRSEKNTLLQKTC